MRVLLCHIVAVWKSTRFDRENPNEMKRFNISVFLRTVDGILGSMKGGCLGLTPNGIKGLGESEDPEAYRECMEVGCDVFMERVKPWWESRRICWVVAMSLLGLGPCLLQAQVTSTSTNQTDLSGEVRTALPKTAQDLGLEGGPLSGRMKFSGNKPEVTLPGGGGETLINRRELLRLKDQQEEKANWMFLEPGQLQREREKKEEQGSLRDRWDVQDDFKKKSWLEYGTQKSTSGSEGASSGAVPELKSQSRFDADLRNRQLQERDVFGRGDRGRSSSSSGSRDRSSVHQYRELNMSDLVNMGEDRGSRYDDVAEPGLKGLFGGDYLNTRDRDEALNRKKQFTEFLNQSRVGGAGRPPADTLPSTGSPGSDAASLRNSFGMVGRISARDGLSGGQDSGASGSALRGAYDPSRGSDPSSFYSRPTSGNGFRGSETPRIYITPEMMQPPKRRF